MKTLNIPMEGGAAPLELLLDESYRPSAESGLAIEAAVAVRRARDAAENGLEFAVGVCESEDGDSIHLRLWCNGVLIADYPQTPALAQEIAQEIIAQATGEEFIEFPGMISDPGDEEDEVAGKMRKMSEHIAGDRPEIAFQVVAGLYLTTAYWTAASPEMAIDILQQTIAQVQSAYRKMDERSKELGVLPRWRVQQ